MKTKKIQYWKITPGEGGYLWREQKLNECIAIGWSEIGNAKNFNKEKLHRAVQGKPLKYSSRQADYASEQLDRFINQVSIRDKVIASTSPKGIYAVGTIIGNYEFNNELGYKHSRKVQWETTFWSPVGIDELNREHKFPIKLYDKFHGQSSQTIRDLTDEEWQIFSAQLNNISTPFRNLGMWGGLIQAPEYESEVIILFSHMLQHLHMRIIKSGVLFPDAIVEQKKGDKWQKINVEFELHSSGFRSHLPDKEGKCDLIICWEDDDWGRDNHQKRRYKIIELKEHLKNIL
jgi:hypothetical protein